MFIEYIKSYFFIIYYDYSNSLVDCSYNKSLSKYLLILFEINIKSNMIIYILLKEFMLILFCVHVKYFYYIIKI